MIEFDEVGYQEYRDALLREAREEARAANPLIGYCERVSFARTSCKHRNGPKAGTVRRRKTHEVELLKFLPSGRCVAVKDLDTPGLHELAEEALTGRIAVSGDVNLSQLFLEYFRQL